MLKWISAWVKAKMSVDMCWPVQSGSCAGIWWIFLDVSIITHGSRAPCQCKHNADIIQMYKIYKYIQNIYISPVFLLQWCTFIIFDPLLLTSRSDRLCAFSVLNPSTASQGDHRSTFWLIKSSFLHLEVSVTAEAHSNKGFLGVFSN